MIVSKGLYMPKPLLISEVHEDDMPMSNFGVGGLKNSFSTNNNIRVQQSQTGLYPDVISNFLQR